MLSRLRIFTFTAFALSGLSCNMSDRVAASRTAVQRFHQRLDAQQYDAIFVDADELLHKRNSAGHFTALLAAVHRKLGLVKQSDPASWTINATTQGVFVKASFKTDFTGDAATESFSWHLLDGQLKLVSYGINSAALTIK